MINIGKLDRRVTLVARAAGQDALGQPVDTWTAFATVWADIRHKSGLETLRGDAEVSLVAASIRIRYRADVLAGHRVVDGSVTYDIRAVLADRRAGYLDLICQRVN